MSEAHLDSAREVVAKSLVRITDDEDEIHLVPDLGKLEKNIAEALEAAHAKGRQEERERCAKIAESFIPNIDKFQDQPEFQRGSYSRSVYLAVCGKIIKAIREDTK